MPGSNSAAVHLVLRVALALLAACCSLLLAACCCLLLLPPLLRPPRAILGLTATSTAPGAQEAACGAVDDVPHVLRRGVAVVPPHVGAPEVLGDELDCLGRSQPRDRDIPVTGGVAPVALIAGAAAWGCGLAALLLIAGLLWWRLAWQEKQAWSSCLLSCRKLLSRLALRWRTADLHQHRPSEWLSLVHPLLEPHEQATTWACTDLAAAALSH